MKRWWLPALLLLLLAAVLPARAAGDRITVYPAYSDGIAFVIEGRVIEQRDEATPSAADGKLRNLWRNARRLTNDERKRVPVEVSVGDFAVHTQTDNEGYFHVEARLAMAPGWYEVRVRGTRGEGRGRLLVVPPGNALGLISDLDDTILVSEVTSKSRLLANSLLKNAAQRQAVPGMAELYARTLADNPEPALSPLFYLSASPRQLHEPIADFIARNAFPEGLLITKRVTDDRSSEPLLDQVAYKTRHIEAIFARLPWVRFVLVGDDGEKDPEIYDAIQHKYPERVAGVWIRRVSPEAGRPRFAGQLDAGALPGAPGSLAGQALATPPQP